MESFELSFVLFGKLVEIDNDNPGFRLKHLGEEGQIRIYECDETPLCGIIFGNNPHKLLMTSLGLVYMDDDELLCIQTKNTCYKWKI